MKLLGILILFAVAYPATIYSQRSRSLSGVVSTSQNEFVRNVIIEVKTPTSTLSGVSDSEGAFAIAIPDEQLVVSFSGKNLGSISRSFSPADKTTSLSIRLDYVVSPLTESVTIQADTITPQLDFRNDSVYQNTLFGRDDQLVHTLNAGISAGQHEGGGKSLEIRRYGFNLDHGGVGGGLRINVDNLQQNQGTQGHGQGYLGSLKSISPELVQYVTIINGPFSAAYGDFSGLGVIQIQLRESLPQILTARVHGGSFDTVRAFVALSPTWGKARSYFAYEPSYTNGPFKNPLGYRRDNISGNLTYNFNERRAAGVKLNFGRSNYTSSGQIPLDLVADGRLDRFGFIDPENGGRVKTGSAAIYFRNEQASGATFKADAFVSRTLFDLFSNFTFFAADPIYGDEIQQHDSRLQEGGNLQYLLPYKVFGTNAILTAGGGFNASQVNVGLYPSVGRVPNRKFLPGNETHPKVLLTSANARINNASGYVQSEFHFLDGHLRAETGLRFDHFTFKVDGFEQSDDLRLLKGSETSSRFQPKASISLSPFEHLPVTFFANYGRGIASQDARGVVRSSGGPKLATTDFFQSGAYYNSSRFSFTAAGFLIDRSNEQVYIPDDGSIELTSPSRSYGIDARASARMTKRISLSGGFVRVLRAFYPAEVTADGSERIVSGAPHFTANAGLVLSHLRGFNAYLNWRHISSYRADGDDPSVRASGHDVVDIAITRRIRQWVDFNFSIDNLLNKRYFETQNYFESRSCPTCDAVQRIHATPGYPLTVSAGVTFRIGKKN